MAGQVTIGIDMGGTKVLGLAVDDEGVVLAEVRVPTPGAAASGAGGTGGEPGTEGFELGDRGPGIGDRAVPRRHRRRGGVGRGRARRAWSTTPACCATRPTFPAATASTSPVGLSARLGGMRTVVDNDATCATVAEWAFGAAAGVTDAVMVTLGTGIGGGDHRRWPRGAGGVGLRRGDRPHGGRPHGAAVPVRQAGLLGAIRLGERSRATGPRGGPCRTSRRGGEPRRWGCGVGAGRARDGGGQGRRRRRAGRARRARVVAGPRALEPGRWSSIPPSWCTAVGWSRP